METNTTNILQPEIVSNCDVEPAVKKMKTEHETEETNNANDSELIGYASELSKRQQRKLRKKEKWLANKPLKRAKEKEKLKQKKLNARLNNVKLGPSRKELKHAKMSESSCKVHVVVDLSFDDLMNNKEMGKCIKQLHRCYSLNRRSPSPMQFHVTSFDGKSKQEMEKHSGYTNWDGICHRIAQENGINHGQLPIGEFLDMKSRKVLTIDHVFEILLQVTGGKSWKDAFLQVLPSRKGAIEKTEESQVS
ncbi:tRNA methyltransferase 10 A [Blattella germanica]|nr:tRNA methyltransferase 10 A [Blattella germanica]